MLRISRFCIIFLLAAVIIIYGRPQFRKLFLEKENTPQINYSFVLKKFLIADFSGNAEKKYYDEDGRVYNKFEYQTFLPMIYYRDLLVWKKLPEKIGNTEINPMEIEKNRQLIIVRGHEFDSPEINLYPLYESDSLFSQIEKPQSMFRINSSMEFIDAETNSVLKEKSDLFTKALEEKGFCFPAKKYFGNRTRRKPFDEGYFIEDSSGELFHLKMKKGLPFVKATGLKPGSAIKYIKFEENMRREFYGVMFTEDNGVFLISCDNYKLIKLPVEDFDHEKMSFFMVCDLLKRTIRINNGNYISTIITDKNYNLIASHRISLKKYDKNAEKYSSIVFPLSFEWDVLNSGYVHFKPQYHKQGMVSGFFCALIFAFFLKYKKLKIKENLVDIFLIGAGGAPFLISVLIAGPFLSEK